MASVYTGAVTAMTDMTWTYRLDCTHAVWEHEQLDIQQECTLTRCYATSITRRHPCGPTTGTSHKHNWLLLYPCGPTTGTTT